MTVDPHRISTQAADLRSKLARLLGDLPGDREDFSMPPEEVPFNEVVADIPASLVPRFRDEAIENFPGASLTEKISGSRDEQQEPAFAAPAASSSSWDGWAPDFGTWFYTYQSKTGTFVATVYHYLAQVTMSWDSARQLRQFAGNTSSGLEMNMAYYRWSPGVEESASGDTSVLVSWVTDFPGAYRESVTVDDDLVTYAIGTHEAEKLRWQYETDPNFYEDYFIALNIDDRANYSNLGNRRPYLTLYAQKDLNMACGGTFADACFFSDGAHNFLGGNFDAFPVYPVYTWNYIP